MYKLGMKRSVNRVPIARPPMTVMANGAPMREMYSALPIASGNMATMVVIAVMRMGLTRAWPAVMSARTREAPFCRRMRV